MKESNSKESNFGLFFKKPINKIAVFCLLMFAFQQLSGINVIMYYAPTIYKEAGFVETKAQLLAAIFNGLVFVISTSFGTWLVDRIGRRILFFIGSLGMF